MSTPTQLTCIAIDDDTLFLKAYEPILNEIAWIELLGMYDQPVKAATAIIKDQPDVIFLDLEMPHIEGDDLLEWLSPKIEQLDYLPKVIMVSSYVGLSEIRHPLITAYFNKHDFIHETNLEEKLKELLIK